MSSEADRLDRAARALRRASNSIGDRMRRLRTRFDQEIHAPNAPWTGPGADRMFRTIDSRNSRIQSQRSTMEWLAGNMERAARDIRREDEEKRRAAFARQA